MWKLSWLEPFRNPVWYEWLDHFRMFVSTSHNNFGIIDLNINFKCIYIYKLYLHHANILAPKVLWLIKGAYLAAADWIGASGTIYVHNTEVSQPTNRSGDQLILLLLTGRNWRRRTRSRRKQWRACALSSQDYAFNGVDETVVVVCCPVPHWPVTQASDLTFCFPPIQS